MSITPEEAIRTALAVEQNVLHQVQSATSAAINAGIEAQRRRQEQVERVVALKQALKIVTEADEARP